MYSTVPLLSDVYGMSVGDLEKEKVLRTTEGGFLCTICGTYLKTARGMKIHLRDRHTVAQQYRCPICKRIYKNKNSFCNHLYTAHKDVKGLPISQCAI